MKGNCFGQQARLHSDENELIRKAMCLHKVKGIKSEREHHKQLTSFKCHFSSVTSSCKMHFMQAFGSLQNKCEITVHASAGLKTLCLSLHLKFKLFLMCQYWFVLELFPQLFFKQPFSAVHIKPDTIFSNTMSDSSHQSLSCECYRNH